MKNLIDPDQRRLLYIIKRNASPFLVQDFNAHNIMMSKMCEEAKMAKVISQLAALGTNSVDSKPKL